MTPKSGAGLSREEYYGNHYAVDTGVKVKLSSGNNLSHKAKEKYQRVDREASNDSVANWKRSPSRNVTLALLFTFGAGVGRGTWSFTVLSGYLYQLTDSHGDVGVAEGAQGIAQLVVALVAGYLIDKWNRRDKILKLSAVIGIVAACAIIFTLSETSSSFIGENRFFLITVGLTLFGSYQGFWNTALETIYADSVPTGLRDKANSDKFVVTLLSTVTGPVLANIYFLTLGSDLWKLEALRDVFIGGVALCVPPMFLLCMFRDSDCLGASADAVGSNSSMANHPPSSQTIVSLMASQGVDSPLEDNHQVEESMALDQRKVEDGSDKHVDDDGSGAVAVCGDGINILDVVGVDRHGMDENASDAAYYKLEDEGEVGFMKHHNKKPSMSQEEEEEFKDSDRIYVLRITAMIDLISGLGSGMSIKFFPLYFENKGLTPAQVNWVYITAPLVMAVGSHYATDLGVRYGRPQIAMLFGLIGALAIFGLGFMRNAPISLCLVFYYLSCAQHCSRPLKKSILMDFCKREHRGGWNAVDSITRFGWSGSAVAGGYIIDAYSYEANYIVTSIMLAWAACCWLLLFNKTHTDRGGSTAKRNRDISESISYD